MEEEEEEEEEEELELGGERGCSGGGTGVGGGGGAMWRRYGAPVVVVVVVQIHFKIMNYDTRRPLYSTSLVWIVLVVAQVHKAVHLNQLPNVERGMDWIAERAQGRSGVGDADGKVEMRPPRGTPSRCALLPVMLRRVGGSDGRGMERGVGGKGGEDTRRQIIESCRSPRICYSYL